MANDRCPKCGWVMTFAGFDRRGQRVLTCTSNLMGKDDSIACNDTYYVNNRKVEMRKDDWWHK